jgi:hypothetical protein
MHPDKSNIVDSISNLSANLPAPIKSSLMGAIGALIGDLTAVPRAWLRRYAQEVDDTTAARSFVSRELEKRVAEQAGSDPETMNAAMEVMLPSAVKKARNRVQVAELAVSFFAEAAAEDTTSGQDPSAPDADWIDKFTRFAEDASSERLQDLFARILAGEVRRPGSYSLSTLRVVSELDKSLAEDFQLVWAKSVGESIDYSIQFHRGEWFVRWKRLAEAGLMSPTQSAIFPPAGSPLHDGLLLWAPIATRCSIPDDHIDPRRSALFMARSILREVREGVGAC